jgi:hypothetical protein
MVFPVLNVMDQLAKHGVVAMMRHDRQRRSRSPIVEGLEPRNLLSAGVAPHSGEVHELRISIPAIKGTIHGTITSITPISSTSEVVDYTAQGKANIIGDGRGFGQHTITSKAVKKHPSNDTYSKGQATIVGTTDTVNFSYSGTGHTNANGSFTATLHGRATSVAGEHAGLSGSITAQISGNNRTGSFTISFSVKL